MQTQESEDTVLKFYRAFDNRNIDRALSLLAPNFVAHMAGISEPLDSNGFKKFGMEFYSAFTNGQHQFDEIIVEGSKVVTCGTFTAIHSGEFQGLPPTDKQVKISVMHIDRVENGSIVEHWGQGDVRGLMQQLGIVFFPGPKLAPYILKNLLFKILNIFN